MRYLCPEPLTAGDTIGLVTPSSPMMPGRLEAGISYLEQKGFRTKVGRHVHDANRFMAGTMKIVLKILWIFFLIPR